MGYLFDLEGPIAQPIGYDREDGATTCRANRDILFWNVAENFTTQQYNYYLKNNTYDGLVFKHEVIDITPEGEIQIFINVFGGSSERKRQILKYSTNYLGKFCCEQQFSQYIVPQIEKLSVEKTGKSYFNLPSGTKAFWDDNTQTCRIKPVAAPSDSCATTFKIVLNPKGNDGNIFNVGANDTDCSLNVEFDYLFKLDCAKLQQLMVNASDPQGESTSEINLLRQEIAVQETKCETIRQEITTLTTEFSNTSYSVTCENFNTYINSKRQIGARITPVVPTGDGTTTGNGTTGGAIIGGGTTTGSGRVVNYIPSPYLPDWETNIIWFNDPNTRTNVYNYANKPYRNPITPVRVVTNNFNNTGFGDISSTTPFAFYQYGRTSESTTSTTFCISEPNGLTEWQKILGPVNYEKFTRGDSTSYTCEQVATLYKLQETNGQIYLTECTTAFTTKARIKQRLDTKIIEQTNCNTQLELLNAQLTALLAQQTTTETTTCKTITDVLETLDVSFTLDVVESDGSLTTVYEFPLFPTIGTGNLYEYLLEKQNDSGFYVCGKPDEDELVWAEKDECVPLIFEKYNLYGPSAPLGFYMFECEGRTTQDGDLCNVSSCRFTRDMILRSLYTQSGYKKAEIETFKGSLSQKIMSSNWLNYNEVIDDPNILESIKNKKIKISLKVNNTCSDICVMLDNIKLNKECVNGTEGFVTLTQSPGFNLTRIVDNKKSWVSNTSYVNREFVISNPTGGTSIRNTDYEVLDERLVINTKEIDLNMNIASAIETDVWCYINDNNDILNVYSGLCKTQEPLTFSCPSCGSDCVSYDSLTSTNLANISSDVNFKEIISSEMIDVKNRKTISKYATLRAFYDKYLHSSLYTTNLSLGYTYDKMRSLTDMVGNYWTDIVEQVIPSTTIWGNTIIYGNTLFDQQKFQYKTGNLMTCINGFEHPSNNSWDFLNECVYAQIEKFYSTCGGGCETGDCNAEITTFSNIDFMDDLRIMPTSAEIDSFASSSCASCNLSSLQTVIDSYPSIYDEYSPWDYQTDYRSQRDAFVKTSNELSLEMQQGYCYDETYSPKPNINAFKTMIMQNSPLINQTPSFPWNYYLKGVPQKINNYHPYKISLDSFWFKQAAPGQPLAPGQILSAYTDHLVIRKSVANATELPLIGQAGDIIRVGGSADPNYAYFWWNPQTSAWIDAQNDIFDDYYGTQRAARDAFLKAMNELVLSIKPMVWAGNYMLLHPFKKWPMQNATPVTGKQIIETNGDCLPCGYDRTTDCEITNTYCEGERYPWSEFSCDAEDAAPAYLDARSLDFMDSLNFMPTGNELELLGYTGTSCNYTSLATMYPSVDKDDFRVEYRDYRDNLFDQINDVIDGMYLGFKKSDFPTIDYSFNPTTAPITADTFSKGHMRRVKHTWWSKASAYTEWNSVSYPTHGVPLSTLLSGVGDLKYLSAVSNTSSLPSTATKGDLICVGTSSSYVGYAWDPILNSWSTNLYDFIENQILIKRRFQKNNAMSAKRNLMLSLKPMLWSNEYLISENIRNWHLSDFSGYTVQKLTDIVASNGASLPPKYTMTASTHTLSGFTATTIIY